MCLPHYANTPGNNTYSSSQNYLTDAGAYGADSQNYYGLNDMSGNVHEWHDSKGLSATSLTTRGGSWDNDVLAQRSSTRFLNSSSFEDVLQGFRVASVPEPSAMVLTILFGAGLVCRRKR